MSDHDESTIEGAERAGASTGEIRTTSTPRLTGPPAMVDCELIDGNLVFEGDIIIGPASGASGPPGLEAVAITGDRFRWRNGVVPFEIDSALPNQSRVTDAIAHWETNTALRFRARANGDDSFLTFAPGNGCSSHVGRQGGGQVVTLGASCSRGNAIHEIAHAAGLWHEQSREDRDSFVTVNWSNIEPGREHNFNQHITDGDDIGPYDYGSIMHYGAFAFAKDPTVPTITASQPIGQRNGLSDGDRAAIRALYYFRRLGDSADLAGESSEIAAVRQRPELVVTAVRTAAGTLKLISWRVATDGSVARAGDSGDAAGEASHIAIAKARFLVTGCRAGNGDLKLISWDVTASGAVSRLRDSGGQAGDATLIRIAPMSDTLLVTACRAADGSLKLISWRLGSDGSLDRLQDSGDQAGAVFEIALIPLGPQMVATAVRAGNGALKIITWNVASDGKLSRRADSGDQAGEARMIRTARSASGHLLTSVRAGNGRLKLISWNVAADGRIDRAADSGDQAGLIQDNALLGRAPGAVSAVRADNGNLKLIAWQVDAAGQITRAGDSYDLAGDARLVCFADGNSAAADPIVTAVRAGSGNLKLIAWHD